MCGLGDPFWPGAGELRVGLGCMRLSTGDDRDETVALETIAAAVDTGIVVFDTARAYARDTSELGHNEALVARALRACGAGGSRIVTKGGMSREGGGWLPDGRARTIRADCEASLTALDGLPIDLYLLHAPDPRTPWRTSVRALARLVDDGLVRHIGVSNVNRAQLDAAVELAPIAAVQVAVSVFDDHALRGGVVERCENLGIAVLAHSPLGGPRRAGTVHRNPLLSELATRTGATPAELALAWVLDVSPNVVALPGATRPETARSAARAAHLRLDDVDRDALRTMYARRRDDAPARGRDTEVVMVMGVPGAGKTSAVAALVLPHTLRLNRDERGGSLRGVAAELDRALAAGTRHVVLDNTYLTRAARSHVIDVGRHHGASVRCVWIDTPIAQAQVNLVGRLLDRFGSLPSPDDVRQLARNEPGVMAPTSQMRAFRDLEPPAPDEGFVAVEQVPFVRVVGEPAGRPGVLVAAGVIARDGWQQLLSRLAPAAPHLLFEWRPDGTTDDLAAPAELLGELVTGPVTTAVCPHPGGPPLCWCRPPLAGLLLAWARDVGVALERSVLIGTSATHRTLANTLGATHMPG